MARGEPNDGEEATDTARIRFHSAAPGAAEGRKHRAHRRVLVDGVKQRDIASELHITVQGISAMVARAWRTHVEHGERPEGWRAVHVTLPENVADVVEEMADIARRRMLK